MPEQTEGFSEDEQKLFDELMADSENDLTPYGEARRHFLKMLALSGAGMMALQLLGAEDAFAESPNGYPAPESIENLVRLTFKINGAQRRLDIDSRMTLLDTLRERLQLTGSKKGCDHGQCGACTVMVEGRRVLSCLTLAASCEGKSVTSIEGLAKGRNLHPMQAAFVRHDGFQCGYCTPGQICSAVALLAEAKKGDASYVSRDLRPKGPALQLSDEEIRERMSGNICRCGAYPNIVAAIREVQSGKAVAQQWQFDEAEQQPLLTGNQTEKGGGYATI